MLIAIGAALSAYEFRETKEHSDAQSADISEQCPIQSLNEKQPPETLHLTFTKAQDPKKNHTLKAANSEGKTLISVQSLTMTKNEAEERITKACAEQDLNYLYSG